MTRLASSMTLTWGEGVHIDGIEFPFAVAEDVEVTPGGGRKSLTIVNLPVLVRGVVVLDRRGKRRVIDSELGDVGEWARNLVRAGLIEAFPWLKVPLNRVDDAR